MTEWTAFAGVTGVVLVLLLVLSHLTQTSFSGADDPETDSQNVVGPGGDDGTGAASARDGDDAADGVAVDRSESIDPAAEPVERSSSPPAPGSVPSTGAGNSPEPESRDAAVPDPTEPAPEDGLDRPSRPSETDRGPDRSVDPESMTTGMVLANVAASQGLFTLVLLGALLVTGIPLDALGIDVSWAYLETGIRLGLIGGLALYAANEVGAAAATRFGFDHDERLRELLAPDSTRGWLLLLLVVLPIIAVFEELLFRAALIGVLSTGFGLSPWLLAIGSSVAFALGHGMQGSIGILVTGVLGFVLAAIFVVTGSLLVVVVAHYLINALEFVVHEGFEFDWAEILES